MKKQNSLYCKKKIDKQINKALEYQRCLILSIRIAKHLM